MTTLTITTTTPEAAFTAFIRERLAAGEHVTISATEPFMTPQELADSIGVSRSFISKKITAGEITTTHRGRGHRISLAEAERFRAKYTEALTADLAQDF